MARISLACLLRQQFSLSEEQIGLILQALRGEMPPAIAQRKRAYFKNAITRKETIAFLDLIKQEIQADDDDVFAGIYMLATVALSVDHFVEALPGYKQACDEEVAGQ